MTTFESGIMTHKTRGIILRTIRYGETSLIVTALTERFGNQSYLVNGVRSSGKQSAKAALFQPASVLDLEVYHHPQKNLQRIKEQSFAILFQQLHGQVIRHSIALFMVELMYKTIRQPEEHAALYAFCEDALCWLDRAEAASMANFPIYFALHLPYFLGLHIATPASIPEADESWYLDWKEGYFCTEKPLHPHFISGEAALATARILQSIHPDHLHQIPLSRISRQEILRGVLEFYALHLPDFAPLKSVDVLQEIMTG